MATLVKRISWDKIKVNDRIRVEAEGDIFEFSVEDVDGNGLVYTSSDNIWAESDGDRVYRLKEDY